MARPSYSGRRAENRRRFGKALRGTGRFRKLLRRLPDAVRGELLVELRVTGRRIRSAVLARTPKKTGALQGRITDRVLPRSLRLQVGLLGTRAGQSKLFYGRIQDLGREAQTVVVTRRMQVVRRLGNNRNGNTRRTVYSGKPYTMKVRAMPGKRFVTGRYPDLRAELKRNLRDIYARSLARIAGGADE